MALILRGCRSPGLQRPGHPEAPENRGSSVQVTVSARHGHLDDETQKQLQEKAEKLLTYFDRLTSIMVTVDLHRERDDKVGVEILAKAEHKHEFVAREAAEDPMAAFNLAADKIKMQLRHYKERLQDHRRDPSHNDVGGK
jgi:putative sigma-54 modulation protein